MSKRFKNIDTAPTAKPRPEHVTDAASYLLQAGAVNEAAIEGYDWRKDSPNSTPATPPPSRRDKVQISGYFSPEMRRALRVLAAKEDRTQEALMAEAFDDLLRKYDESPVGG